MLIYNVTIKILSEFEEDWLHWMKTKHIPDVMNTGSFTESHICRLLDQPDEEESTFVIQYRCESIEKLNAYFENFSPSLREEHNQRYKDKFVAFRTVMEVIE